MSSRTTVEFVKRTCPECKTSFETRRLSRKYCSSKCRWMAWNRLHPRSSEIPPEPEPANF